MDRTDCARASELLADVFDFDLARNEHRGAVKPASGVDLWPVADVAGPKAMRATFDEAYAELKEDEPLCTTAISFTGQTSWSAPFLKP